MIKFKQILKEDTIEPAMAKLLNIMAKRNLDPNDISDNISILQNQFVIKDISTASNIAIVYKRYYDELGADKDFKSLKDVEIGYNIDDYDEEIIALYQHLDGIHPDLLIKGPYGDIEDVINSSEYRVLTEDEADEEFKERANEDIDNQLSDSRDLGWLSSYVELDDDSVRQFAEEHAEYRVGDMSDDEIIEEADIQEEVDRLEEELELKREKLGELDNLISDLEIDRDYKQDELDTINEEITDLTTEIELSTDQDEINNLKDEIHELNIQKYDLSKEIENYDDRLEELQTEFDELEVIVDEGIDSAKSDLAEQYKDDVIETMTQSIIDEVEYEGIDYFVNNLGYSVEDAVNYYGTIDRESAILDMEDDRGNIMSSYDGVEWEEQVNGVTYYIYQTN